MKRLTDVDVAKAYAMWKSKTRIDDIARHFHVHRDTIRRRLVAVEQDNRLGVKKRERVTKLGLADKQRMSNSTIAHIATNFSSLVQKDGSQQVSVAEKILCRSKSL